MATASRAATRATSPGLSATTLTSAAAALAIAVSPAAALASSAWGGATLGAAMDPQQSQVVANFQLYEDHLAALTTSRAAAGAPAPVVGTRAVRVAEGTLLVDVVAGANPNATAGGTWLRARGVQYAEQPVGALRWQPPVPKAPWDGVASAQSFATNCVNTPFENFLGSIPSAQMGEACLYLNVWAPANATKAPVLFWIHGGSFTMGGTSEYSADGVFSYRRDVVLVTANYRLGALGWLGGPAVQRASADGSGGNFGLQDTREALRWVQRNIEAFGGDPNRVTIFGESAGSSMVETHLVAPRSDGLFQQAIMQSGAFDNYTVQTNCSASFDAFAAAAGCAAAAAGADDDGALACLRAKPLRNFSSPGSGLMAAVATTSALGLFSPCVDGVELTAPPEVYAATGRVNPSVRATVLGTVLNEGRYLMPLTAPVPNAPRSTAGDVAAWLAIFYPGVNATRVMELYADEARALDGWQLAAEIYTDSQYLCPTRRSARWLTERGRGVPSTFVYRLEYQPSVYPAVGLALFWRYWCAGFQLPCDNMTVQDVGVGHSSDVYLTFADPRLNATDRGVSRRLIDWWVNFARSGDPNASGGAGAREATKVDDAGGAPLRRGAPPPLLPPPPPPSSSLWPRFGSGGANATLRISAEGSAAASQLKEDICEFWAGTHRVPYG